MNTPQDYDFVLCLVCEEKQATDLDKDLGPVCHECACILMRLSAYLGVWWRGISGCAEKSRSR